jgi:hypothetical protein
MDSLIKQIGEDKASLPALFAQVAPKLGATSPSGDSEMEESVDEDLLDDFIPKTEAQKSADPGNDEPDFS